ncbi:MAG: DivIVA domain-containing protein [Desulfopila sp.]|jgi:DivIVA domain-containing protein|nr:DivIVA domain-containing protein [Desulfopila sp.]
MAITPQAIKDQEFMIKFRGYDTVEVKAYLELIAEEFFELLEQVRQQIDELDVIVEERDVLQADKRRLQEELNATRGSTDEIRSEFAERDTEVAGLRSEIQTLKAKISDLEQQSSSKDREIADTQMKVKQKEQIIQTEKDRNDKLLARLDDLEKQNTQLRSEEIDFKSTLVAAQQFTTEMKRKSEQEAKAIITKAKSEAEKIRQDTFAELASYPAEIDRLKAMRNKVRHDLEEVLQLCMENLDIFKEEQEQEDYGELFQKIKLDNVNTDVDDLDAISMNFDLPGTRKDENEDIFSMKDETDK